MESPAPPRCRAVLFDFDYTLADSAEGVIDCIRSAQRRLGLLESGDDAIRRTIGLSMPETLATLNGEEERPRADEFTRLFMERADEVMASKTFVYEGVGEVLADLGRRGVARAIATTKVRYRIEQVLAREGLADQVERIVGAEDVKKHKPDPECLVQILDGLRLAATEAIYVGDSPPDAGAAAAAGIPFVLVETGLAAPAAFERFPVAARLRHVADLPQWLTETERA